VPLQSVQRCRNCVGADRSDRTVTLSTLIVTFQSRETVLSCLGALRRSTAAIPSEVVVIDNASSDGTGGLVRQAFPDIRVVEGSQNLGFGQACNLGSTLARGEYLLLLNPDCMVDADTVDSLIGAIQKSDRIAAVGPVIRDLQGRRELTPGPEPDLLTVFGQMLGAGRIAQFAIFRRALGLLPAGLFPRSLRTYLTRRVEGQEDESGVTGEFLSGACLLLRRAAFQEVKGFDPKFVMYYEDVDLAARLRQHGWQLWFEPSTSVVHVVGVSSGRNFRRYHPIAYRSLVLYLERYEGLPTALAARVLITLIATVQLIATLVRGVITGEDPNRAQLTHLVAWSWGLSSARLS
jgi:GT2 family glycosyltransferase